MLQSIDMAQIARGLLQRGHTTRTLGAAIGLSQPAVSRLAAGKTADVAFNVGAKLVTLAGGSIVLPEDSQTVGDRGHGDDSEGRGEAGPAIGTPTPVAAEAGHAG